MYHCIIHRFRLIPDFPVSLKGLFLIVFLLVLNSQTILAQRPKKLFTGIAMYPTIARSSEKNTLNKFSLNGELRIRYQFSRLFALETGPGFINHGFRFKTVFQDSATGEEWTEINPWQINYFTLPLRLRLTANGFTMAAAYTPEIFLNSNPNQYNWLIRSFNSAWQFSLGYDVKMYTGGILTFELFHTQPFNSVFKGYKMQNTGIAVSAIFPIIGPGGFAD